MSQSVQECIERVINNLLPETAFNDEYGSPQSLAAQMTRHHTPGVSIAVINDYEIEWARGFGICEAGKPGEITPDTLFQAGSISKPIFALAVMRLVQDGRLDLDEDVNKYLTSWQVPANKSWLPRITLRHLLSHTAGLTVHGFPGYQVEEPLPTVPQLLSGEPPSNTKKVEVNILPGLQVRYSGGGTTIAQQLLVDLLGKPFPEIMRALVLDPLNMIHSTYEQPLPADWVARAATAHPWKGIPLNGKHHIYPEMAAAGLWTTAIDLAKVGVELLKVLDGQPYTVLAKETIETMLRPQLSGQKEGDDFAGLGFFCRGEGDGFRFGHGGWDEGFVALIMLYKNIGKGAVVMLNSNEGNPILEETMRAIGQEYDWPDVFPQDKAVVNLERVQDYPGVYLTEAGVTFTVTSQDGGILLQVSDQPPLPLFATSDLEFFAKAINTKIAFEKDDQGVITAVHVSQSGQQMKATRQD